MNIADNREQTRVVKSASQQPGIPSVAFCNSSVSTYRLYLIGYTKDAQD